MALRLGFLAFLIQKSPYSRSSRSSRIFLRGGEARRFQNRDVGTGEMPRNFLRDFAGNSFYLNPMLIWIIAIVLFLLLGSIGYSLGAIRMTASLIGLFF